MKKGWFYSRKIIEKDLRAHIIEWAAVVLGLLGAILNAERNINGFIVWGAANILWLSFSWKHRHWGLLVMNFVYLIINVYGFVYWK